MKRISTVGPKCGWSGWLSQPSPIPRSPDGDKNYPYLTLYQNWYRTPVYSELAVSASPGRYLLKIIFFIESALKMIQFKIQFKTKSGIFIQKNIHFFFKTAVSSRANLNTSAHLPSFIFYILFIVDDILHFQNNLSPSKFF